MEYGIRYRRDLGGRLPELFLGVGATFLVGWGAVVSTGGRGPILRDPRNALSRLRLGLVGRLLRGDGAREGSGGAWGVSLANGGLTRDARARGLEGLVVVSGLGCLRARRRHLGRVSRDAFEYPLLRLFAILGRFLLLGASDLRRVYRGLELQSLCLYVLAAFARGSAYSTEAGLKYFVLGALASGIYLLGASLLYGFLGTTDYPERGRLLAAGSEGRGLAPVAGASLVTRGFRFKLAAVPFHTWSPDVLEGAPVSSSRFLASVTKIAALGALVRFLYGPCFGLRPDLLPLLRSVAGLSRVVAALGALRQRRVKRFLGYSAIGHVGYRLVGVSTGTVEGLQGVVLYTLLYVIGSVTVWAGVRGLRSAESETSVGQPSGHSRPAVYLTDLGGLGRRHPALAVALVVGRLSRAGIPPRAGFYAKLGVFLAAREASLYGLALTGVRASVVGAFYYLRWVKIRLFEGVSEGGALGKGVASLDSGSARLVSLGVFARTFFVLYPSPLLRLSHRRAVCLCLLKRGLSRAGGGRGGFVQGKGGRCSHTLGKECAC